MSGSDEISTGCKEDPKNRAQYRPYDDLSRKDVDNISRSLAKASHRAGQSLKTVEQALLRMPSKRARMR